MRNKKNKLIYDRKYYHSHKKQCLLARKKYYAENKEKILKHKRIYRQENKEKIKQDNEKYHRNHFSASRVYQKQYNKKYNQTEKGKQMAMRRQAIRKRNLNWIKMFDNPFANNVAIDYHHITDVYVVAIPSELHEMYTGKYHREKVMDIVKQIYLGGNVE